MTTTVPWVGSLADWTDLVPPSLSVSFASTLIAVAPESSATVGESSAATGLSSTQLTATDTVACEPPLSV